jgi:hypothetical protein
MAGYFWTCHNAHKMKKTIIFLLCLFAAHAIFAQNKKNAVYLEAGGNTIFYSTNYDRIIPLTPKLKIAPRVGFMYLPMEKIYDYTVFDNIRIPLELNFLWSRNPDAKNFVEGGLGLNLFQVKNAVGYQDLKTLYGRSSFSGVTTLRLGFRHQKPEGGLMYRAGVLIPVYRDESSKSRMGDDIFYVVWAGLSLGYTF